MDGVLAAVIDAAIKEVYRRRYDDIGAMLGIPGQAERAKARRPPHSNIRAEAWRLLRAKKTGDTATEMNKDGRAL